MTPGLVTPAPEPGSLSGFTCGLRADFRTRERVSFRSIARRWHGCRRSDVSVEPGMTRFAVASTRGKHLGGKRVSHYGAPGPGEHSFCSLPGAIFAPAVANTWVTAGQALVSCGRGGVLTRAPCQQGKACKFGADAPSLTLEAARPANRLSAGANRRPTPSHRVLLNYSLLMAPELRAA